MMLYKPKMLGNTVFEVEVNTEINKNYLDDYGNVILAYLRESLQNDDIVMTIKISEATVVKKPLTSREIFDELVHKNPSLQKLSDEFDLELS
ncbi:MAG: DNA polymerase III subunit gamma/tau, partial [Petrimonas sp.]|nr:DNA polymerase III subunit gamma/tau [Petrimonas sp.]MEA5063680.1 DNA polymerase III subunit gamma/tau [Petrimonas sp.]